MSNKSGKHIDKTCLSIDNAEDRGFIHRDYIAHCLRWSHFIKCISKGQAYKTARVLDIGCGREAPLAKTLYSSKMFPSLYVGIDIGNINQPNLGKYVDNATFITRSDIVTEGLHHHKFNFIVCFEVLEHVEPDHCIKILKKIYQLLTDDGMAFISTPCWDVTHTAGNHVNEMRYEVLGALLERHGFSIHEAFGTFASIKDYQHKINANRHLKTIFDALRNYYDTNFLACIFAPLFPNMSRNCLWKVVKKRPDYIDCFDLGRCEQPWSSSEKWEELDNG